MNGFPDNTFKGYISISQDDLDEIIKKILYFINQNIKDIKK